MQPSVSILIPARNEQHNIVRTLNSIVVGANMQPTEIIVGVNNSTDDTFSVVENYIRDFGYESYSSITEIKAIRTKDGKVNTWNELLFEHARCNYCVFVDADVVVDPLAANALIETLSENPDLPVAAGIKRDAEEQVIPIQQRKPLEWNLVSGSLYACNKRLLLERMRDEGYDRMPSALIHEDIWLTQLLRPDGYKVVFEAVCFHDACTSLRDFYKKERRCHAAQAQLEHEYPRLASRVRRENTGDGGEANINPASGMRGKLGIFKMLQMLGLSKISRRLASLPGQDRPVRMLIRYARNYFVFHIIGSLAAWHGRRDYFHRHVRGDQGYWLEFKKQPLK